MLFLGTLYQINKFDYSFVWCSLFWCSSFKTKLYLWKSESHDYFYHFVFRFAFFRYDIKTDVFNSSDFIPIPESSIEIINLHISCFLTHETLSSTYPLFVYFIALSRREINIFLRLILSPYIYSGRSLAIFDLNSMLLHLSLYVVIICFKISLILYLVLLQSLLKMLLSKLSSRTFQC